MTPASEPKQQLGDVLERSGGGLGGSRRSPEPWGGDLGDLGLGGPFSIVKMGRKKNATILPQSGAPRSHDLRIFTIENARTLLWHPQFRPPLVLKTCRQEPYSTRLFG